MCKMRKSLSFLLAVLMCLTCLPVGALADEEAPVEIVIPLGEAPEETEEPEEEPAEEPAEEIVEEIVEEPAEEPAEEIVEEPAKEEIEIAADEPAETEMQPEVSAEVSTEESVVEEVDLSSPALDGASVVASGTCGDDLTWTLDEDGVLTISGTGAMEYYSSDDDVPWYDNRTSILGVVIESGVINIERNAFYNCSNLTSVSIPDSVIRIGYNAFYKCCSLTSVSIPDSVTSIGEYAFYNCSSLTSVNIPESVTSIGYQAFSDCTGLTSIIIPSGVTNIDAVFYNCSSLTSVSIPDGVTSIGEYAFYNCSSLTSVHIPDSVTNIGKSAFYNCRSLTDLNIPESVTKIGQSAFCNCNLTSVSIFAGVTSIGNNAFKGNSSLTSFNVSSENTAYADIEGVLFDKSCTKLIDCPALTSGDYTIPEGVISIENDAFSGCSRLTSITIPESVTSIGNYAFSGCSGLMSVSIPNGVTSIGYNAFEDCSGLMSVSIPNSVTSIGSNAFEDCSNLASISIPAGITSIGWWMFHNCSSLTSVSIPDSVSSIEYGAFEGCDSLTDIYLTDIAAWLQITGANPLNANRNEKRLYLNDCLLEDLVIPDSVTSIGSSAFEYCTSLTSVSIPDSVTSIGDYAFEGCSNLTSVSIPDSVTSIGYYAFGNCSSLTSVNIPESVTSISERMFYNCSSLVGISIPESVTSIGGRAFYGCSALTSVSIPDGVTTIEDYTFRRCSSLTNVSIPDSVISIGEYAFGDCSSLASVSIPDSVTNIAEGAFFECNSLTGVTIPSGVTSIESFTFSYCDNLTSITIPDSVTSIGGSAFYVKDSAEITVYVPDVDNLSTAISGYDWEGSNRVVTYASAPPGGTCGDVAWTLKDGVLTITGDGEMTEYGDSVDTEAREKYPWYAYREEITAVEVDSGCTVARSAFHRYPALETVTLKGGADVAPYAFASCPVLKTVTIGTGTTSIGAYGFAFCEALDTITLPDTLQTIGVGAFTETALKTVTLLDESGQELAAEAAKTFWNTASVGDYNDPLWTACGIIPSGSGAVAEGITWTFGDDGTGTATLTISGSGAIPDYVTVIRDEAPDGTVTEFVQRLETPWSSYTTMVERIVVEEGITGIGAYAFSGFSALSSLSLPEGLVSIGDLAFRNALYLKSFELPVTVTSVGESAFYACWGLKTVTYDGTEEQWNAMEIDGFGNAYLLLAGPYEFVAGGPVGESAFWEVDSEAGTLVISGEGNVLAEGMGGQDTPWGEMGSSFGPVIRVIIIGEGITTIDDYAFWDCSEAVTVSIPASLESIGQSAFEGCESLATVYYNAPAAKWAELKIGDGNDPLAAAVLKALSDASIAPEEEDAAVTETESVLNETTADIETVQPGEGMEESEDVTLRFTAAGDSGAEATVTVVTKDAEKVTEAVADENTTLSTEVVTTVLPESEISEADAAAIEELEAEDGDDAVSGVAVYVDLSVNLVATTEADGQTTTEVIGAVTETAQAIRFTMQIAKAELDAMGRGIDDVYIVRVHDGVAEKLWEQGDEYTEEDGVYTLYFSTDKFSSYMLMFRRVLGDINGDNVVAPDDLLRLVKYILGDEVTVVKDSPDVNGDGNVNILDLVRLLRYMSGRSVKVN